MTGKTLKRVLVIDDDTSVFEGLKEWFDEFSSDRDVPYQFELVHVLNIKETGTQLRGLAHWDVVIIDRRWIWPLTSKTDETNLDWEQIVLASLCDLGDLGLQTLRIVFTANWEKGDLIERMRLGVWDYLDKLDATPDKSAYQLVVESAIAGLQEKDRKKRASHLAEQCGKWQWSQKVYLLSQYANRFVPLELVNKEKNEWQPLGDLASESLFELYTKLRESGKWEAKEEGTIHVVWVAEQDSK